MTLPASIVPSTPSCACEGGDLCPGAGRCHCGCGKPTSPGRLFAAAGHNNRGLAGSLRQRRYPQICPYHGEECTFGYRVCHCGCGEMTALFVSRRYVRDEPTSTSQTKFYEIKPGWPFLYKKTCFNRTHRQVMWMQKITPEQAASIRRRYIDGTSQEALAREHGVAAGTINAILRFKRYPDAGIAAKTTHDR